ncbi:hypothetical protein KPZU09_12170 [Klebsiella pneumoniae]|uniref:Uncharacterized protein n=1 Tax=Klebsiella pneumoniae TaxID=573 RepID=A0A919HWU4_KLEPN|nr:hypothetical protein KPZU09_12170 [Klebsiella pneumoniae]
MGNAAAAGQTQRSISPPNTMPPRQRRPVMVGPSSAAAAGRLADQEIGRVRRARRCAGEVMAIINVTVGRREDQQAVAQPAGLLRIVGDKHHRATGQQGGRRV